MFQGVVHKNARTLIKEWIPSMPDRVYVGCAGNFTIPALLRLNGYCGNIFACDVSLYSSALGCYLSEKPFHVEVKKEEFFWLGEYLDTSEGICATISIMLDMLQHVKRDNQYRVKMWDAYRREFGEIHEATIGKLRKYKEAMGEIEYEPKDVFAFLRDIPAGGLIMSFPPTYKGGYERLYKHIEEIFSWEQPAYTLIDGFWDLFRAIMEYDGYRLLLAEFCADELVELLGDPTAIANRGLTKDIYMWTNLPVPPGLIRRHVNSRECKYERFGEGDVIRRDSVVSVQQINSQEAMYLRQVYLSNLVNPAPAALDLGVFIDGKLFSILGFANPNTQSVSRIPVPDSVYLMYDMPVSTTNIRRGAKLNLFVALSKEVQQLLRGKYLAEVKTLLTTAFSKNPVSMKYRGLFQVLKRKEMKGGYAIDYAAPMGKWAAQEGLSLWMEKHGSKSDK